MVIKCDLHDYNNTSQEKLTGNESSCIDSSYVGKCNHQIGKNKIVEIKVSDASDIRTDISIFAQVLTGGVTGWIVLPLSS